MKSPVLVLEAGGGLGRGGDPDALAPLRSAHPHADLTLVAGSIATDAECEALASTLRSVSRGIGGVILGYCGRPEPGRMLDQPADMLAQHLAHELVPRLAAARQLLPLLAEGGRNGTFVVIGSPGSDHPWAGYGYRSVAAAAATMLVRVLHDEARAVGVRVQMLAVSRPVRTVENGDRACQGWPAAQDIGVQALALIDQADPQLPVQAVVRYEARKPATRADEQAPSNALAADAATRSIGLESQRVIDVAWAVLEPILEAAREKNPAR